ncbi:MAG: hypothetical protein ACPGVU_10490 [Limisphaerales bacterium]
MELLGEKIDLRANSRQLFADHRPLLNWIVLTAVLDVVSTMCFMQVVGPQIEINPIIRVLTHWLGIIIGPIIGKLAQLFAVWVLALIVPRLAKLLCILVIALNSIAFLTNMRIVLVNL